MEEDLWVKNETRNKVRKRLRRRIRQQIKEKKFEADLESIVGVQPVSLIPHSNESSPLTTSLRLTIYHCITGSCTTDSCGWPG